jgi:hypothetical protein
VAARMTFHGKAEAVRDVQFNPFYSNYFGAAFDSGSIQVRRSSLRSMMFLTIRYFPVALPL